MRHLHIPALLLLLSLLLLSCDRTPPVEEPPTLPPITMEGKGTFGCLVNGKVWLPNSKGGFYNPKLLSNWGNNEIYVEANAKENDTIYTIRVYVKGLDSLGIFELIPENTQLYLRGGGGNFSKNGPSPIDLLPYTTDPLLGGEITILGLDTTTVNGRYVAGTFWFDMRNREDSTDIIQIRDGRFDVRLNN